MGAAKLCRGTDDAIANLQRKQGNHISANDKCSDKIVISAKLLQWGK